MAKTKRRWGDRRDGRWVRDVTGLQCVMTNLMPNRTDCEVCLSDKFPCRGGQNDTRAEFSQPLYPGQTHL